MVRVDGSGSANSLIKIRGLDKKYRRELMFDADGNIAFQ